MIRKEKKADSSNEPVVSIEDTKNLDTLLSLAKIWALIFTFITIPAFFFSPLFSLLLVLVQLIINFITYQKKIHPVINFILFVIVGKELLFMDIFNYDMYGSVPAMASGVILLLGHILFVCLWYFKFYKKSHKSVLQNQNYSESHHLIFLIKSKILFYTTLVPVGLAWLCVGVLYLFLA